MWLITTFGFFSVVQKPGQRAAGTLTVRGRVRADLEALRDQYLPALGPIKADAGTDYRYRAVAPAAQVAAAICAALADIDYANFKDAVSARQGSERAGLYHELWHTLWKLNGAADAKSPKADTDTSRRTASPSDVGAAADVRSRFVDTEQDLACWGIPVADAATDQADAGTNASTEANAAGDADADPERATAFGGVVFDDAGRVLLRKPTGGFGGYAWTFPKGRPGPGEPAAAVAAREVREETGVRAAVMGRIPGTFRGGTSRTAYYRMVAVQEFGDFDRAETERVVWADPAEARRLIAQTRNAIGRTRDLDVLAAALKSSE